jgi:hypothetical protein
MRVAVDDRGAQPWRCSKCGGWGGLHVGGVGVGGGDEPPCVGKTREHGCGNGVVGSGDGALANDVHGDGRGCGKQFVGRAFVKLVVSDKAVDEFGGVDDEDGAGGGERVDAVDVADGGGGVGGNTRVGCRGRRRRLLPGGGGVGREEG